MHSLMKYSALSANVSKSWVWILFWIATRPSYSPWVVLGSLYVSMYLSQSRQLGWLLWLRSPILPLGSTHFPSGSFPEVSVSTRLGIYLSHGSVLHRLSAYFHQTCSAIAIGEFYAGVCHGDLIDCLTLAGISFVKAIRTSKWLGLELISLSRILKKGTFVKKELRDFFNVYFRYHIGAWVVSTHSASVMIPYTLGIKAEQCALNLDKDHGRLWH